MVRVIALTQFVFLALGTMALIILTKADAGHSIEYIEVKHFLSVKGYWMIIVPIGYVVIAAVVHRATPSKSALQFMQGVGIVITIAIFAIYGWLILGA